MYYGYSRLSWKRLMQTIYGKKSLDYTHLYLIHAWEVIQWNVSTNYAQIISESSETSDIKCLAEVVHVS